jgi:hypothetical protein
VVDEKGFSELVSAIVVQAAIDFGEAHRYGLINEDCTVNAAALKAVLRQAYPSRCPLPKWMEPSDIYSAVTFLFASHSLDDIIPDKWEVNPDSIRFAIVAAAKAGKPMNHFFNFDTQ